MTIIAATDFSPAAANATASAVLLARKMGDALLPIRVVEDPLLSYPELGSVAEAVVRGFDKPVFVVRPSNS